MTQLLAPKALSGLSLLPPALEFNDCGAFAFETLKTRMPINCSRAIDYLHRRLGDLSAAGSQGSEEDMRVARQSIGRLSRLKYEMQTAKPMEPLDGEDVDGDLKWWQAEFARFAPSAEAAPRWWEAPWLFSECYMYRSIRHACTSSKLLSSIDPFQESKETALTASWSAIRTLGEWTLLTAAAAGGLAIERRAHTFELFLQFSLWANKSDLSLLANFDGQDSLDHLQAGSEAHLVELLKHILHNDDTILWRHVQRAQGSRLDIVLDNAGFELFADLCLVHWLVQSGYFSRVVFHGKAMPWFVSDVTRRDLDWTLAQLSKSTEASLVALGHAWQSNFADGTWQYQTHPFWTSSFEFACMEEVAPDLYAELGKAYLVIFKGDLNGRKLIADRKWQVDTPFSTALAGFFPAPLCCLRSLKSNTLAGVAKNKADAAASVDEDWLVCGKYAVIQACLTAPPVPAPRA